MSSDSGQWCLIESDPGVFTELMKGFGAEGLECEEVYDLSSTERINDALGLIFLFKFDKNPQQDGSLVSDEKDRGVFFAKQLITNACATQAIIHILLNIDNKVPVGDTLSSFKSFVSDFDSGIKGLTLSNSDQIRTVHNSFSTYQMFEFEDKPPKSSDDVYHFVSYLPINGVIYELDGLKEGPIDHGKVPDNTNWIDVVRPVLQKRMERCVDGNFNLLAVVPNRLQMYQKELAELQKSSQPPVDLMEELKRNINSEKTKASGYRAENLRRKHNYLPLVVELLKVLSENNRLVEVVEKAKVMAQDRQTTRAANAAKKIKFS